MLARKRLRKRRLIKLYTLSLLILVGLIYLIWYSPVFVISSVDVKGADISKEKLYDILGENPEGGNMIFWDAHENRTLDPDFSGIEIDKDYLNRSVSISINERKKNLIWCFEVEDNCYWVDKTGFIFGIAPRVSGNLTTVIKDMREVPLGIGKYTITSSMNDVMIDILKIIDRLEIDDKEIVLEDIELKELVVISSDGTRIVFSLIVDPSFTEPALRSLMESDDWERIQSVNLTVEGRAYPSY